MRRFEDGKRFWEIRIDDTTVSTRSGKLGTDGKALAPKRLTSADKTAKDAAKRIAERIADGFVEVTSAVIAEPANPELEGQIVDAPTDVGRCLVYADWLQGQGHPRGELGVLQSTRSERPEDSALAKAEQKLFEAHPELAPARFIAATKKRKTGQTDAGTCTVRWANGFITAARVGRSDRSPYTVRELIAELLAHPAARFLCELRIGGLGSDAHDYAEVIDEIIRGCPSTLRTLALVDLPAGSAELLFANLADITPLLAATPLLEELHVAGNQVQLGAVQLPRLRRLAVATTDPAVLSALAEAGLPALEDLEISAGDAPLPASSLAKLLAAPWRPRRLAITRTANTDELVPVLASAPLVETLACLDLSGGKLGDAGGGVIVARQQMFAHLATLELSRNALSPAMTKQLASVCASVRLDEQRAAKTATISDADLRRMSPDASALAKGREVARVKLWPTLARDEDTYWGTCRGSELYEVYVTVPSLDNGCSCPSGKRPCKHAIALAILIAGGHAFEARRAPSGLRSRAASGHYYGAGE